MSEKKLILSTTKSIHKPIEVEVDGKTYANNPFSRTAFQELKKHEKAALKGDIEALYTQVRLIFPIPMDVLNKLDIRDVNSLLDYAMAKILVTQTKEATDEEKAEKNGPKPGQNKSV